MSGFLPRGLDIWFGGYLKSVLRARKQGPPKRVWLSITDHYEPLWNRASDELGRERVALWSTHWRRIAARYADSAGRHPKYSFFYPEDEYAPHFLDPLAEMTREGIADVEIHIHHNGEGEQNFLDRMTGFIETLQRRHGLLHKLDGKPVFGFIHGNWCLDNSRPDGLWCGLNNEIRLLRDLGCYADFTLPSAPSPTQTRMVNTIYWATDDPQRPKSHDTGVPVVPGGQREGDLLMIQGPLALNWGESGRVVPRLENGELAGNFHPTAERVRLWFDYGPRIGQDLFIKLYTHGTQENNSRALLLNNQLGQCFELAQAEARRCGAALYFASAWEMAQAVQALRLQRDPAAVLDAA